MEKENKLINFKLQKFQKKSTIKNKLIFIKLNQIGFCLI